ncbi:hypothetical protein BXZ70DRAFT_1004218 [Cristinia sonorae]|uniref:Uncharacterized protein n=1 Tax=Cristinia sonorae TaxID=1940300 RepID=A0A8K0UY46_9AGAR|nr:hypothetical protein BXZ70DRAFT_1004218 [Cristinia sonorae]
MAAVLSTPPPRMPSPHPVPAALPSPPHIPRRSSRSRLHPPPHSQDPPIPPRLIGSPILHRLNTMNHAPYFMSEKAHSELWLDGDEFGAKRKETAHLRDIPLPSPVRRVPRTSPPASPGARGSGSRSPPPTPRLASPPPPVPPIPSSAFATPGTKRSAVLAPQSPAQHTIPEIALPATRTPPPLHDKHSTLRRVAT